MALALSENDLALTSPCPTEPVDSVRAENETDADFTAQQRDHVEVRMKYDLDRKKWDISNRKCLMVAKSTISDAIRGSILDCDTTIEYLKKVESQFTGSAGHGEVSARSFSDNASANSYFSRHTR